MYSYFFFVIYHIYLYEGLWRLFNLETSTVGAIKFLPGDFMAERAKRPRGYYSLNYKENSSSLE